MSKSSKIKPASRVDILGKKSFWAELNALAAEHKACNLGQGYPDFAPPSYITEQLAKIPTQPNHSVNQYPRPWGHVPLVRNLSKLLSPLIGRNIDPMSEIVVSIGAFGALSTVFQAFVEPGDEVIIIEPFFDCYEEMTKYSGGSCRFIPLEPKSDVEGPATSTTDWGLDFDKLRSLFNEKTKAIVLNTPHNPLGKMFRRDELQKIADLCMEFDCLCISDEVYQWFTFDDNQHISIASLEGMWERTLTIGSGGKTFGVTGWKLGWAYGPAYLMKPVQAVHRSTVHACATPIQEAVSRAIVNEIENFDTEKSHFKSLSKTLQDNRDQMANCLKKMGFVPVIPEGGYFMVADASNIDIDIENGSDDRNESPWDLRFVRWLTINKKLATIPTSMFYSSIENDEDTKRIRLCLCKSKETLGRMAEIFAEWEQNLQ